MGAEAVLISVGGAGVGLGEQLRPPGSGICGWFPPAVGLCNCSVYRKNNARFMKELWPVASN